MKLKLHTQSEQRFVAVMVDVTFSCFIMHTFSLIWYLVAHATCYLPNYCHGEIWCFYTNRKNKGDYKSSVCPSKKLKKMRSKTWKLSLSDIQPIIVCWDEIRWDCTSWKNMQPNSALASKLCGEKTTQNQKSKKEPLQNETSMRQVCYSYLQSFGEMS